MTAAIYAHDPASGEREKSDMDYPWYTKLILGVAIVLLISSPSASSWRFFGEWSPSNVALIAIGLMLAVLVDYTAHILGAVRNLNDPRGPKGGAR